MSPAAGGEPDGSTAEGVITVPSPTSVDETVDRLRALLAARGLTLFTVVDHSGEARRVGLEMPDTKLVIFGSPKGGTPVMVSAPLSALDLPLKLLVWDHDGSTGSATTPPPTSRPGTSSPTSSRLPSRGSRASRPRWSRPRRADRPTAGPRRSSGGSGTLTGVLNALGVVLAGVPDAWWDRRTKEPSMTRPQDVPSGSPRRDDPWSTRMLGALRSAVAVVFLGDLAL